MPDNNLERITNKARMLVGLGKLDEAIGYYREALQIDPYNTDAYREMGNVFEKRGELIKAVDAYLMAGQVLLSREQFDEALKIYNQIISIENGLSKKPMLVPNVDQVKAHLIAKRGDIAAGVGNIYLQRGATDEAIKILKGSLEVAQSHPTVHTMLGVAYMQKGMDKEAFGEFQEVVRLAPNEAAFAYERIGEIFVRGGKPSQATIVWFRNAGDLYAKHKQLTDAARAFEMILTLDTKHKDVLLRLWGIYTHLGMVERGLNIYKQLSQVYSEEGLPDSVGAPAERLKGSGPKPFKEVALESPTGAKIVPATPSLSAHRNTPSGDRGNDFDGPVCLIVTNGSQSGQCFVLKGRLTTIGRATNADICLSSISVSSAHAELTREPDGIVWLTDCGSTNGTFVNGVKLQTGKPRIVKIGDWVSVGDTTLFVGPATPHTDAGGIDAPRGYPLKPERDAPPVQFQSTGQLEPGVLPGCSDPNIDRSTDELYKMVGLLAVKKQVRRLISTLRMNNEREKMGLPVSPITLHMVFKGNPGTGKTTVARLLGRIYHALGYLEKGHTKETSGLDLMGQHLGETAPKVAKLFSDAQGGVLFIDEAYALTPQRLDSEFRFEAIDSLTKQMEDHKNDVMVIVAGYSKKMDDFMKANPGLKSRFNCTLMFEDYEPEELLSIFDKLCSDEGYVLASSARASAKEIFEGLYKHRGLDFGNGRDVRNIYEVSKINLADRIALLTSRTADDLMTFAKEDFEGVVPEQASPSERAGRLPVRRPIEELFAELDSMVGMTHVKEQIRSFVNLARLRRLKQEKGLPQRAISMHMVFAGPPGTGKTSVARLVGEIYHSIGLLSKGQTVEVDRSKLVGKYQGHSAALTADAITKAIGGVLFVDEAYSLNHGEHDDFGREATETVLKGMDDNRDDLLVIIAGYTGKMRTFIDSNPGFQSRFPSTIMFENYSPPDLLAIFEKFCRDGGMSISELATAEILEALQQAEKHDGPHFGNGRAVRNYFERCLLRQSSRLASIQSPTEQELMTIEIPDVMESKKQ